MYYKENREYHKENQELHSHSPSVSFAASSLSEGALGRSLRMICTVRLTSLCDTSAFSLSQLRCQLPLGGSLGKSLCTMEPSLQRKLCEAKAFWTTGRTGGSRVKPFYKVFAIQ